MYVSVVLPSSAVTTTVQFAPLSADTASATVAPAAAVTTIFLAARFFNSVPLSNSTVYFLESLPSTTVAFFSDTLILETETSFDFAGSSFVASNDSAAFATAAVEASTSLAVVAFATLACSASRTFLNSAQDSGVFSACWCLATSSLNFVSLQQVL